MRSGDRLEDAADKLLEALEAAQASAAEVVRKAQHNMELDVVAIKATGKPATKRKPKSAA